LRRVEKFWVLGDAKSPSRYAGSVAKARQLSLFTRFSSNAALGSRFSTVGFFCQLVAGLLNAFLASPASALKNASSLGRRRENCAWERSVIFAHYKKYLTSVGVAYIISDETKIGDPDNL